MYQHIIAAVVFFLFPVINYVTVKELRSTPSQTAKEKGYWLIYLIYWLITIPILLIMPSNEFIQPKYIVSFNVVGNTLIWLLISYMIFTVVLPLLILPFSKQLREKVTETYDEKLYPVTPKQQLMFVFVAITVGICEEIIFRGFLFNYLQEQMGISPLLSLVIISLVFGAGHFMQGVSGVITLTIFGLIMGYLYFTTGSLLVPIIVHILYDAKAIYITRVLQKSA